MRNSADGGPYYDGAEGLYAGARLRLGSGRGLLQATTAGVCRLWKRMRGGRQAAPRRGISNTLCMFRRIGTMYYVDEMCSRARLERQPSAIWGVNHEIAEKYRGVDCHTVFSRGEHMNSLRGPFCPGPVSPCLALPGIANTKR